MQKYEALSVMTVVTALGGAEAASDLCGVSLDAIRKWREKDCIPPLRWPVIVRATGGNITYDMLEAIHNATEKPRKMTKDMLLSGSK